MNKIFKVIWSKSKQCYIVVSEMAKNHSGKKKIVVASILAAMAVGTATTAFAVTEGPTSADSVALGKDSSSYGGNDRYNPRDKNISSVSIGNTARTNGAGSIAIGSNAQSGYRVNGVSPQDVNYGVAIGRTAVATGDYGVGIGYNTRAALHGIAMGEQARAVKEGATTLGVSSRGYGNGAIAVGWQALAGADVYTAGRPGDNINNDNANTINNYGQWGDMAVGLRAMATGGNATALGRSANATAANAIAIGGGDGQASNDNVENTIASGQKAAAIGYNASASGTSATALGTKASASAKDTFAAGTSAKASASNATAIGTDAQASKDRTTAIGYEVRATGKNAVAIGSSDTDANKKVVAAGESAIAVGTKAQANNESSTAIGKEALAGNANAIALGTSAEGKGDSSTAIGKSAQATKAKSIALGNEAEATAASTTAIGDGANAEQENAVAIGKGAISGGTSGIAMGNDAQAQAADAIAVGSTSRASKANDSAFGNAAKATGGGSTAIGYTVNASGDQSFGAGSNTSVSGSAAVGIGYKVTASGDRSISIGNNDGNNTTTATGSYTVAIGSGTTAGGSGSVAIGKNVQNTKNYTTAIGINLSASESATASVLMGYNSTTQGNQSVNIGSTNTTEKAAQYSTAIGYKAKVGGKNAIAIGSNPDTGDELIASATNSVAIGTSAQAKAEGATALGYGAGATSSNSLAFGTSTSSSAEKAVALGNSAAASANSAIALGDSAQAKANHSVAIGTNAKVLGGQGSVAIGWGTEIGENEVTLSNKVPDVQKTYAYLLDKSSEDAANDAGNGIVAIGKKRSSGDGQTIARRLTGVAGAVSDYDAVNLKQVKALESKERHIKVKTGNDAYTPDANGKITLNYVNGKGEDVTGEVTEIKDVAKKSVVDGINTTVGTHTTQISNLTTTVGGKVSQSDFNAFKEKAITFTGDDNAGVARTLGTTLTVKGGANYTSTTANTNIRVEKDGTNGANGLLVKLSDTLSGMKEIAGTGSSDLVIKNGDTKVTVKAPTNGDTGTVDFGKAKVVASNLEADITYRANSVADTAANTVKLKKGLNFVVATDATTTAEGPKSGLSITTGTDGLVTFGLDKTTRSAIDNSADKDLSNLSDAGKDKFKELAKDAAKTAVKVAPGINTTVTTDTTTIEGTTIYKVNANDTTVAVNTDTMAISGGTPDATTKVRAYTLDLSDATKGKLTAVGGLATVIGGTTIVENGTVTGPTFNITKADGGTDSVSTLKDAIDKLNATNAGQNTKISETAGKVQTLEGKVTDLGTTVTNNYNDLSTKITQAGTEATAAATSKGLDFTGDDTTDTGKVHRNLGETLTIKGGANFTRGANENNIKVVKNDKALDIELAENLGNIKEIDGDGAHDLVIKNGDATIAVKPGKAASTESGMGTVIPATNPSVDFGDTTLVAKNLDASIKYRANNAEKATANSVKLADGFNFVAGTGTVAPKAATTDGATPAAGATTTTSPTASTDGVVTKKGIAISTAENGVVNIGLDSDTRGAIDNAANKDLSNLTDVGKGKVKELAGEAAKAAVTVAPGINTTVTTDTTTTSGVTTYKVNANDTTVAVTGDGLTISGGTPDVTTKVRAYTLDLSDATKGKLAAVGNLANVIGGTTIAENGTVTGPTFNITKADGTGDNATTLKDAIDKLNTTNAGQNTKISETAGKVGTLETNVTNLGNTVTNLGNTVTNLGNTVTNNYNDLSNKITQAGTNVTSTLTTKGLDFSGDDTTDTGKVHRDLGETLTIKGGANFTRGTNENNIKVVKNDKALDVELAENLANMKEIAGDGAHDLVIKNGTNTVTITPGKDSDKGTVNFGNAKVIASNLEADITYRANNAADTAANSVKLKQGLNFVAGTGTVAPKTQATGRTTSATDGTTPAAGATTTTSPTASTDGVATKKGIAISTAENGVVNIGLDSDTRGAIDNAASKDYVANELANLNTTITGNANLNFAGNVTKDAQNADVEKVGLALATGTLHIKGDATDVTTTAKGDTVTIGLTDATKGKLTAVGNLATVIGGTTIAADGTVTGPTFNITKADGTSENATTLKDAIDKLNATNAGQNTKISETAGKVQTLEGKVTDLGTTVTNNYNDLSSKITQAGTAATAAATSKGLDFTGDDTTAKVHRDLGETLTIKGGVNFTRGTNENNIKVVKNVKALDVELSENLANMKEIAGDGTHDLVIKNGTNTVTITPGKDSDKGTVNFGNAKVIASNLEADITYRANSVEDAAANTVKLKKGLNFVAATDATTTAEGPKSGLSITTGTDGLVTFGLDKATREKVDNAADKNLSNLSDDGKNKITNLAKAAAKEVVKVDNGINTTVTTDTTTTEGTTIYKVNANDTTVAVTGDALTISGGTPDATTKVRAYTLDLSDTTKGKLTAVGNLANVIGGTTIATDGSVTGPTFSITKADGTGDNASTLKDAIDKLNTTNADQNTAITNLGTRITNVVNGGMTFIGDDATADKVTRKLGETLNIHGQNNITVKKDATDATTLNVKLASDLKNITSITNADADGKPGSKITIGADGVTIANAAAGQDGAAGETKTVTIGKDGINAGGMNITNVAEAKNDGDATNKKYVDDAITKLQTTVTNNANLRYAGDTNEGVATGEDHLNLALATGTLKVAGTADQIKTVANNGTITVSLDEKVTNKLAKLGDTASNGRDGVDGTSGAAGLTGKDGLNDATLNDKVNALRNGEAGSVVYTNEAGDRVVKAKDGKYYKADEVKADGTVKTADENKGVAPKVVENPQARVVNANGETTTATTLSNIADGKVAANSKEAVNGGQLHAVKSDLATALGGGSKVNTDGSFTGPTYNITKDDGSNTMEEVKTVGDAITKLDTRINNANSTLATKGLDFYGNKDTADTDKVHRNLGEALKVKGAENFTRAATATNNIDVVKNAAGDGFDVKLAENLANMKEIAGDGTNDLVIKNGDTKVTVKAPKDGNAGSIDFGGTKLVASNLDASIKYRANDDAVGNAKTVKLADGFNYVASNDATTTEEGPKSGLAINAEDNGKVIFGLDKATRDKVDNAADKNLSNLSQDGKDKVKELAKTAAQDAVKVADGINTTVTTDTTTTAGVTTYKVNANDTTVAVTGDGLTISGGDLGADKVRKYSLDLSDTVKAKLNAINNVGNTASNGRDGVNGTSGAAGLTGKDGLNNATLNDKVNALRNGEAGSVVYTNEAGDRVVKAKDGKYYKADEVKADGTVKTADENKGVAPKVVENPQARVVNANGETTTATTLSNIADGKVAANSKEAVNGGQLHAVKSDLATALGGGSKVNTDGSFTGPTYNITKDDGSNTMEEVKTVGDAITKLDTRINNANSTLATKGLDFYGNKDTADTDKVHRNLGEALKVKGAENFTRAATATNNIDVVKNAAGDGFDVKLAENLANMKEIAGDGTHDLVIKNGDATITLKPAKPAATDPDTGDVTTPAKPGAVDFGDSNVVAKNLDASITYRANNAVDTAANSVKLKQGLNFVAGTGTVAPKVAATDGTTPTGGATTTTSPTASTDGVATKTGIAISTAENGVVNIGLDSDTRSAIDNAANQDLSNLTTAGKKVITDAAQGAVKVAAGNNVTIDTETKDNVTTYTVNGRDTTVKSAENGSVSVTGGTLNAKGEREYTVDLTDATKAEINRIAGIDTRLTTAEGHITTLQGDMTKAKADIVTNAGNIATNAQNIAINAGNIATNTKNIATNAGNIATNTKNIATNASNIAANTKNIAANTANITKNTQDIATNANNIATNTGNIATNAANITKNAGDIAKLQGNSATKDLSNLTNVGKDVVTGLVNVVGTNGITVTPDTDTTSRVKTFTAKLNDKVTFGTGDKQITVDGTTGTVSMGNNKAVNIDGTTGTVTAKHGNFGIISGLTNTTWNPAAVTGADRSVAATQGQVKDVSDTLDKGRVFTADTGKTSALVALGETLAIKGGAKGAMTDNNIGVELSAGTDKTPVTMTVRLAKDVKMKDGSTSYDHYMDINGKPTQVATTTVNGEGVTITPVKGLQKPAVSLTADGLDNGGNAIHHVGPGTAADDAATLGQVVAAASTVSRQVNQTGAHAAALAAMNPLSYDPLKKSQVMAGYGAYKGSNALALGVAHYANEDTLFNVGVSVGNGENMVNAGMTYRFGGEDSMIPERYKGGPISSVYVMQDEITALKAENARKDAENAKKDAENEEMKTQIKMLIERVTMLEAKK